MTVTAIETVASVVLDNKCLLDGTHWNRVVGRIRDGHQFDQVKAERVLNEALAFLRLCAADPAGSYGPSSMVDIGWHALLVDDTRRYMELCESLAGTFIHHVPLDGGAAHDDITNVGTVKAMQSMGIVVDEELWLFDESGCGGRPCESHVCKRA